jgi:hypothetical protein
MKTETIQQFLDCGGKITYIENVSVPLPLSVTGPTKKRSPTWEYDDVKDGQSPNLKWIGDKS